MRGRAEKTYILKSVPKNPVIQHIEGRVMEFMSHDAHVQQSMYSRERFGCEL